MPHCLHVHLSYSAFLECDGLMLLEIRLYTLGPAFFFPVTLFYPHVAKPGWKELRIELRCGEVACFTTTRVNLNLSLNSNTKIPFWLKYLYTNFKYHTSSLMYLISIRNKTRVSRRNFSLSFPLECWKFVPLAECERCNIGASEAVTFSSAKWLTWVRLLVSRLFSVGSLVRKPLSRQFNDLNLLANLQTLNTSNYPWDYWLSRKHMLPQKMLIFLLNFLCILKDGDTAQWKKLMIILRKSQHTLSIRQ